MYFLCAVFIKKFNGFTKLCTADDTVINKKKFFSVNQVVNRNLLHFGNSVSFLLICRCKASCPGGCVFNKGTCKLNSAFMGVADSVRSTRIGNTAYIVNILGNTVFAVNFSHDFSVSVSHYFNIDSFIAGG